MAARPPHEAQTDSCSYQIDFPGPHDDAQALTDLCAQILAFVASLSKGYIWHKQPLQLGVSPLSFAAPTGQKQHQWLTGKTDVTDAVDDEWFVVWLLRQVTEKWRDAAVAIEDDDGEFLLIEAADVLPSWVTPQNAANRVRLEQAFALQLACSFVGGLADGSIFVLTYRSGSTAASCT